MSWLEQIRKDWRLGQFGEEGGPNHQDVGRLIFEVDYLRLEALKDAIRFHAHLYYNLDRNEISDAEYDGMVKELEKFERDHPGSVTSDSPTQLVGEAISAPLRERR